jgi:hypothetical protein
MLVGLAAVGTSYGVQVEDGAVIGCGIVSGRIAPYYYGSVDLAGYTARCPSEAAHAEATAIGRGTPDIILWGSTEESASIVDSTPSGSKVLVIGTTQWKTVMLQRMEVRVRRFIATGAKVILLLEPPRVHGGSQTQPSAADTYYEQMNALLREVAARHPSRVVAINLATRVCPSGPPCPYVVDGMGATVATAAESVRPDGIHYLPAGSLWVAKWLIPQILAAVNAGPSGGSRR